METIHLASIEFSLSWKSAYGVHLDKRHVDKIHFWRDIFPGKLGEYVNDLQQGESYREDFDAGVLVPHFSERRIKTFKTKQFEDSEGHRVSAEIGKFYPQGWAWKALNCFPQNSNPFRVLEQHNELIVADTNHPLSRFPMTLETRLIDKWNPKKERGGECKDIAYLLTENGPGMQLPYHWATKDSYSPYPFTRKNNVDDGKFYGTARLVNHLDDTALEQIESIYGGLLCPSGRILDLMSSWKSHLPDSFAQSQVTGLGLNQEELEANGQLGESVIHDLNKNPSLPFPDNSFHAVICTSSIEYLTNPLEILAEVARVTVPGGKFITTFSDRWFPGKEIDVWADLHRFERVGLVMDYYNKTGRFHNIHTESVQGLPRPLNDKYIDKTFYSDPVFAVWADVNW